MKNINISMMRDVSIIVACDNRGGISVNKKIPWYYKEDLTVFKALTAGNVCVMGRNTYQEIAEKRQLVNSLGIQEVSVCKDLVKATPPVLLPGRESYVLSRSPGFIPVGAALSKNLHTVCEGLDLKDKREIFVLGGEKLFIEALSWTNKIYITVINKDYKCDKFFPIQVLEDSFYIKRGRKEGDLYFVEYHRK